MMRMGQLVREIDNPCALLTDGEGGYLALAERSRSNYDGWYLPLEGYHKIVANILPAEPLEEVRIARNALVRKGGRHRQEIALRKGALMMRSSGTFVLTLDMKRRYDESDNDRIYKIEQDSSGICIAYPKARVFLYIATDCSFRETGEWRKMRYEYDERRGTPSTPWVHEAGMLEGEGLTAICAAHTREEAVARAHEIFEQGFPEIREHGEEREIAQEALLSLATPSGILAGIPWFTSEWSRDELISLGGVILLEEYGRALAILEKWYGAITPDGRLPALWPDEGLESSDAPGWLAKRTLDLLSVLKDRGRLHLAERLLEGWRERTGALLDTQAGRMRKGLLWSGQNTTWMDTSYEDRGRAGARIEIQALALALHDCHAYLCRLTGEAVRSERAALAKKIWNGVRRSLVKGAVLLDGLEEDGRPDLAVRPNTFLAHYIAPRLFEKDEWAGFFSSALEELWCEWGGLSSIGRKHPLYCGRFTGEDVASYHRGDSWYWVNNLAAIAMLRVDERRFAKEIARTLDAGKRDLLEQGFIGHASEISSADVQEAGGCHAQAWSASTLLELMQEIGPG